MSWPTSLQYQEAVQNPNTAFRDPVLARSKAILNSIGLPLPSTGNYACVFKLRDGNRFYAVRCFSNPVTDQSRRYRLLSEHLKYFKSGYLVNFEYQDEGIRSNGCWYPIVKMDWAEGETMDSFIRTRITVKDFTALETLAAQWRGLVSSLHGAYMAHGDLQHGNVLVAASNNGLTMHLVDYDGMYIEKMAGEASPEVGHVNYQHPDRTTRDYYSDIDNFSSISIYTTLKALVRDPSLWSSFNTGENLVLSRKDYLEAKKGNQSEPFRRLSKNPDSTVCKLGNLLYGYCTAPVKGVKYLEDILGTLPSPTLQPPAPPPTPPPPPPQEAIEINYYAEYLRGRNQVELTLVCPSGPVRLPATQLVMDSEQTPLTRGKGRTVLETRDDLEIVASPRTFYQAVSPHANPHMALFFKKDNVQDYKLNQVKNKRLLVQRKK
jgi:hypothetical protein